VRSILKFGFVVVPTAVLATAVVFGVSRSGQGTAKTSDGDLQQDLKLASATTLELAPAGHSLATVSAIESPPSATPERTVRPKRSTSGPRVVRSRAPTVKAAPEPAVAEAAEESQASTTTELAAAPEPTPVEAPAAGGVALPRPTAIPVVIPAGGGGSGGVYGGDGDGGGVYGGGGSVIRGGVLDGDHCQIPGRRPVYGGPIYRQPRRISLGDMIRGSQPAREATPSIGDRVRSSQGRTSSSQGRSSSGSSRGSLGDRIRAARGR
jgi:hypothetical protein